MVTPIRTIVGRNTALTTVVPFKADPTAGPIPGTCIIDTGDLVGEFERLKALGVEFVEKEPVIYPNGGGYANFTDPDGNRLSLRGPAQATNRQSPTPATARE